MIAYYENSKGDRLDLLSAPFRAIETDWFDADWEEQSGGYEKKVSIDVFGSRDEFADNMEHLYSVIATDAEEGTYGRLYVNDTFLRCRIQESKKSSWKGYVYAEVDLTFFAPELSWIREEKKSFYPQSEVSTDDGLDFEYDYPFDFTDDQKGTAVWYVNHVTSSDFEMIMYGPCVNPKVLINGYPYEILTTLESGEYLVINSSEMTVMKYLLNGTIQNIFHDRGYEKSVFEKIPSGMLRFNWSGNFGFDIHLFLKRREAKW